jgi:Domain of unknown function (DUF4372)
MHAGSFLFSQLMDFLPQRDFDSCVRKHQGNYRTRRFSCRDQFLCMAFAQLTGRASLRDIEITLNSLKPKLYHAGFRGRVARNTLAKANQNRDWRIYAEFAGILIARARQLYAGDSLSIELDQTVYFDCNPFTHLVGRAGVGTLPWRRTNGRCVPPRCDEARG